MSSKRAVCNKLNEADKSRSTKVQKAYQHRQFFKKCAMVWNWTYEQEKNWVDDQKS